MNAKEIDGVFHCDCGFSWSRGKNGSHNCADGLREKVRQLAAENLAIREQSEEVYAAGYNHGHLNTVDGIAYAGCVKDDFYGLALQVIAEVETPATDRIVAGIKASAIPEGFKLVPEQMYLSDEDIQAICMQCGNGDKKGYGDYEDGILWVGELSNDGEVKYGLNIANANYPEEGSITVFEFDEPLREGADK